MGSFYFLDYGPASLAATGQYLLPGALPVFGQQRFAVQPSSGLRLVC